MNKSIPLSEALRIAIASIEMTIQEIPTATIEMTIKDVNVNELLDIIPNTEGVKTQIGINNFFLHTINIGASSIILRSRELNAELKEVIRRK